MAKAVFAGTFDPFTYGHLSIVKQAASIFDEVTVLLACNPSKSPAFNKEKMMKAIRQCLKHRGLTNVKVNRYNGLVIDYCGEVGADYLIRGLRSKTSDFSYEEEIAQFNSKINPDIKTIYFRAEDSSLSSSLVRTLYFAGRCIDSFVPKEIDEIIKSLEYEGER